MLRCDDLTDRLAHIVDGGETAGPEVLHHVETCLRCQAEMVQYRRLLKALRTLRTEVLDPAPGLLAEILGNLEEAGERRAIRSLLAGRRGAYVGGIAAATAAGAVGAAVFLANRNRGTRLAG